MTKYRLQVAIILSALALNFPANAQEKSASKPEFKETDKNFAYYIKEDYKIVASYGPVYTLQKGRSLIICELRSYRTKDCNELIQE